MNRFTKLAFIALTVVCTSASAQKQAYISLDSIVGTMPETKIAQQALTDLRQELEKEVISMQTELDTKYKNYLENKDKWSETIRVTKETELQQINKHIEDFKVQANNDIQKKYNELSGPIAAKAKKGIAAVAKELGYKSVVDLTPGNILYHDPADNIFAQVKKKLDAMPPADVPGASKNNTPEKGKQEKK
jgi:outer membrane protein